MPNSGPTAEGCYLAYQLPFYAIYYISGGCDVTAHHYGENPPVSATVGQQSFCRLICCISNLPTIHKHTAEVVYRGYEPTYRIIYTYSTVSAQQTNLLPENAFQNDAIFARFIHHRYGITSQCLSSYGCATTVLYYAYIV